MKVSIYHRRRFHPDIIKRVIWLYFRFNLSLRELEELMVERGVDVSYETIRRWIDSYGSVFAKRIKSRSQNPSPRWHLDEVYTKINGKMVYLWRAVDDEGTVLDIVVQSRRNKKAALRLLRKLLKNNGVKPQLIVTDRLIGLRLKSWTCGVFMMLEDARTTEPKTLICPLGAGNENHRNLDR